MRFPHDYTGSGTRVVRRASLVQSNGAADSSLPSSTPSSESTSGNGGGTLVIIITAIILGILTCIGLILYCVLRRFRIKNREPRYIPSAWLKKKWRAWTPGEKPTYYSASLHGWRPVQGLRGQSSLSTLTTLGPAPETSATEPLVTEAATTDNREARVGDDPVDRHVSVRSVMTLPAYSEDVRPTEKVLGREGERAGMDTVIDYPETEHEEQTRYEREMESLYQIRRARRAERAAREEHRRLRREARAQGDTVRLAELRRQQAAQAEGTGWGLESDNLLAQYQARDRGRRVSSVDYATLGVARHDGSRLRANSDESDRPLLDASAPLGVGNPPRPLVGAHFRVGSTSSLRNLRPDMSEDELDRDVNSDLEGVYTSAASSLRSVPRASPASSDQGDGRTQRPPEYNDLGRSRPDRAVEGDAPPYESPVVTTPPRLPAFTPLPAIEVTPFTPVLGEDEVHSRRF